ncbi:MAG: hypothetical protein UU73_C0001G0327 [Candidatus Daviesbacteria bacterium GW2011_GWA1_41_61]|uniref:Ferredoxin n=1 Tax=Candidatus Daviesbacteria bacterium GW2011_GWA2_40_9 TaxID=1618424 RepID=A0A0G0WDY0_9BACT|nr:MAG: hypothetical protein UU26_C0025G0013 [Candidatus Daviesbacteria bacterium GW2011_GWC1_40_9]KKR82495.1 MAG: hypothetical protein UU29_C0012G0033 [Candidatus Daviesbacteria bacterium GW2011_GWA2_40_9]KKR93146.1 MAG: hypothetical protein UU44_C0004G0328 [Candidatus Daviesbacteria bacterium GW2011_GWB1_41_15]KKS15690.1 MAG: hypothetical protein UU73_C0001G0327 [Candidatus Daviesbacteria bacterium GW2011_GWA1_41_61]
MDEQTNNPQAPATPPVDPDQIRTSHQPNQPTEQPTGDQEVQIGNYKVQVKRSLCIGAASCVAISPTTFQLDGENKAVIQQGSTDSENNILMAAQACPTKAIVIVDTQTNNQIWPE